MYRQKILLLLFLLILLTGCQKELFEQLDLRTEQNDRYYWENNRQAARRLARIMYNGQDSSERFKLVHISDPHLSAKSPSNHTENPFNLLQSVHFANQQELRINAMVATGDFIANGEKEEALGNLEAFVRHFYNENYIPSFLCTGNHDCNDIESIANSFIYRSELHRSLFTPAGGRTGNATGNNYYYADVPNPQGGTIRFISLDILDQPGKEYNTFKYASFTQEQVDWLGNVALQEGMSDRHSVIILMHYPFQPYTSDATTYLCDGDFVHSWNMIPEIVEAFRSRATLKKDYPNKLTTGKDIQVDFDFTNSRGEFVCYLGGHAHVTAQFHVKGFSNQNDSLPVQQMLLCTNQAPSETGTVYNRVPRHEDSPSSNSFCIYALDTREHKIYITFFGAYKPSDQEDYPEIQVIDY